jgi:hypothetical protein
MPTPGLSLVGFMQQAQALNHLLHHCVPANPDPVALNAEWVAATAKLGAPIPNAGHPDIKPIPPAHDAHIQQLTTAQWFAPAFAGPLQGNEFKLVELDPLLAYQFTVNDGRSQHHCGALNQPPTMTQLVELCLPVQPAVESFQTFGSPGAMILKAKSLNLQNFGGGIFNAAFMGIQFGVSLPFMHVVRHNNRCYLHNGFHRAVGIRKMGATHAPCIVRDVPNHEAVGIKGDGSTFDATLLESNNPPTVSHFTQGRAWDVQLRNVARFLHVSWAEYVLPEE